MQGSRSLTLSEQTAIDIVSKLQGLHAVPRMSYVGIDLGHITETPAGTHIKRSRSARIWWNNDTQVNITLEKESAEKAEFDTPLEKRSSTLPFDSAWMPTRIIINGIAASTKNWTNMRLRGGKTSLDFDSPEAVQFLLNLAEGLPGLFYPGERITPRVFVVN